LSAARLIIERMFDTIGGIPEDWEPIPQDDWASLPPLGDDGLPAGVTAEYVDSCDRLVDRAIAAGPGADALGWLSSVPAEVLSESARSQALAHLTGVSAHVSSISNELTAAIAGPAPAKPQARLDERYPAQEVAVATRNSVYTADRLIALARDLATVLKATGAAMRRGEVSQAQARALHEVTCALPADIARAIEAKVLKYAFRQSLALFRGSLRRWTARLDPTLTARSKAARAEVEVSHTAGDDGTGQLYIRGPLELTTEIHMAMTAHAVKTKDSLGGTVDQRKLAGLRDWAEAAHAATDSPTHHGRVATVNVVIELNTLLGLNNHPAEIPGVGPLPADGAPLRPLVTDSLTGHLLDYGRSTYTVPPDLADWLIAKNVTSASPHSNVDARLCDMEHNTPHEQGGATDPINTTPVDRRWHRAKTHGDWTYTKNCDSGVVTWASPTRLACTIDPYDYRLGP
jgi:hypothetical protein